MFGRGRGCPGLGGRPSGFGGWNRRFNQRPRLGGLRRWFGRGRGLDGWSRRFDRRRRRFCRQQRLGRWRGFIRRRCWRYRFFEQTVEGFVRADHAHVGARPFLDGHQSPFQIFNFGRQRVIFLSPFRIVLSLRLNADTQGVRLTHAIFVKPEQIMQEHQRSDQRDRQQLQFQAMLGGMNHEACGG